MEKELEQPADVLSVDDIRKQQQALDVKNAELAANEISAILEKYGVTLYGTVELPVTNLKVVPQGASIKSK